MALKFLMNAEVGGVVDVNPSSPVVIDAVNATTTLSAWKFGSRSVESPTSGGGTAWTASSNKGNLLTSANGDFTLELFAYWEADAVASDRATQILYFNDSVSTFFVQLEFQSGAATGFRRCAARVGNGVYNEIHLTPIDLVNNSWHHLAIVREAGAYSFYANGTRIVTEGGFDSSWFVASASTIEFYAGTTTLWMDDVALSDAALYSGTTYTVPTVAKEFGSAGAEMAAAPSATSTLTGDLFSGVITGHATFDLVLPKPQVFSYGPARMSLTIPSLTMYSVGHNSYGENAAFLSTPSISLSGRTGANAQLDTPTIALSMTGTFYGWGQGALVSPSIELTSGGTVSAVASASIFLPATTLSGSFGVVSSITLQDGFSIAATGKSGAVGAASITLPLFELVSVATGQNHGAASLILPALRMETGASAALELPAFRLEAMGTATVSVSYVAYATNLNHKPRNGEVVDEVTQYTNYPFDRIVRYKNKYYGMNSTGLYLLEGATDDSTPIPWSFKTHLTDFDSAQLKNVNVIHFGGRLGPSATVSIYMGETGGTSYSYSTPRDSTAQNYRQPLGLGLRSRYYAMGASGTSEMALDSIKFNVLPLARKF